MSEDGVLEPIKESTSVPMEGKITFDTIEIDREEEDRFKKQIDIKDPFFVKLVQHKNTFEKGKKIGSKQFLATKNAYNALEVAEPAYNFDYLAKLYDASSFHAAAIDAKIDNTVGLGYYFMLSRDAEKIKEKAAKKSDFRKRTIDLQIEDAKENLEKILSSFNDFDEFEQTLEKFLKDRFTMGNGYIEVGRDPRTGRIAYLGHIPAKDMRIRNARDGFVQYAGGKPIFFRNFGDRTTPDPFGQDKNPNEVIHYRKYSPTDNYYGVPEAVSVIQAISGIEFAQRFNIDFFENKTVPRYIIKTRGVTLNTTQQADLLKYFETTLKGVSHRTIIVPIPGGEGKDVEFEPVETKKQDSSFDAYIKLNIQIILSRHRVPQARIGLSSAASSQSESKESDRTFKEAVCKPEQKVIEKKLNKVFAELTDLFTFKLKEYALTDEDVQSQIDERFLRWGVVVPDEIRASKGWQPRSDGKGDLPVDQRTLAEMSAEQAAQQKAEAKSQAFETRTRDQNRNSNTSDGDASAHSRNPKGEGRKAGK